MCQAFIAAGIFCGAGRGRLLRGVARKADSEFVIFADHTLTRVATVYRRFAAIKEGTVFFLHADACS